MIGAERERRKGEGPQRGAAGIRTFTLVGLLGVLASIVGDDLVIASAMLGTAALAGASYLKSAKDDPGLTTEFTLVVTVALGVLAHTQPALAGALGVIVAGILAIRLPLHRLIREALTPDEMRDALVLAIATFVVWPLLPSAPIGPFGALNLHAIWLVVILTMTIGAVGHIVVRLVGAKVGIPIAGFFSGFISSTATIAALAARAGREPASMNATVAGAVLSSIATIVQMSILLFAVNADVLRALTLPLAFAGAAAVIYGVVFLVIALKTPGGGEEKVGRAFSVASALTFGALVSVVLVASAALNHWFGASSLLASTAVAGLVDVHAASVAAASLVARGTVGATDAAMPIVVALSANTLTKVLMAFSTANRTFSVRVTAGLVLMVAAAWLGLWLSQ